MTGQIIRCTANLKTQQTWGKALIAVNNKTDEGNSFLFLRCFVFFVLFFKVAVRTFTVTVRILRADKVLPVWVLSSEI